MHPFPFRLLQSNLIARRASHAGRIGVALLTASSAWLVSPLLVGCSEAPSDGTGGAGANTGGAAASGGSDGSGAALGSGGAPTGGAASTGGAAPTGGQGNGTGGVSTGGAPATGGAGGSGGSGSSNGGADLVPDLSGKTETSCSVTVTSADLSPTIGTVGIVEFSSDLAGQNDAFIEFGETTSYGLWAPVDFAGSNRTLLLGMPANTEHHYRVLVVSDGAYCYGPDQTITTGGLAAGGPNHITPEAGGSSAPKTPGFFLTSDFNGQWIYIFNQDGRIVWFYEAPFGQISRALMSFDGKKMYARTLNVGRMEQAAFLEINMDGSEPLQINLPTSHHDFTVTDDGHVVYIRKTPTSTCDSLYRHPIGASDDSGDTLLFDVEQAFPTDDGQGGIGGESCHTNSVHFNVRDGSVTASDLNHNAYLKVSSAGELEWVLGSADSTFSGDGTEWDRQHGHHLFAEDTLLFFNNGPMQSADSVMREVTLNVGQSTATYAAFSYQSEYGSSTMGDVQRLPNGNTFVTYSNDGMVQEVGPDEQPVQSFDLSTGTGYGQFRPSLYGSPPE